MTQCTECRGSGKYVGLVEEEPCRACAGSGELPVVFDSTSLPAPECGWTYGTMPDHVFVSDITTDRPNRNDDVLTGCAPPTGIFTRPQLTAEQREQLGQRIRLEYLGTNFRSAEHGITVKLVMPGGAIFEYRNCEVITEAGCIEVRCQPEMSADLATMNALRSTTSAACLTGWENFAASFNGATP